MVEAKKEPRKMIPFYYCGEGEIERVALLLLRTHGSQHFAAFLSRKTPVFRPFPRSNLL